jgi:hypothetical protein
LQEPEPDHPVKHKCFIGEFREPGEPRENVARSGRPDSAAELILVAVARLPAELMFRAADEPVDFFQRQPPAPFLFGWGNGPNGVVDEERIPFVGTTADAEVSTGSHAVFRSEYGKDDT